jgi:hypothetical protein
MSLTNFIVRLSSIIEWIPSSILFQAILSKVDAHLTTNIMFFLQLGRNLPVVMAI